MEVIRRPGVIIATQPPLTMVFSHTKRHSDGRVTARVTIRREGIKLPLYESQLNLLAARSRREVARGLEEKNRGYDWESFIDNACREVIASLERPPDVTVIEPAGSVDVEYLLNPVIPQSLPVVIYGRGASGKSLLALYIGMMLETGIDMDGNTRPPRRVLYADWEVDEREMRRRAALFKGDWKFPLYRRCILPLVDDRADMARVIQDHNVELLIVDSAGPACGGDLLGAETTLAFFGALREVTAATGAAALVISHVTKQDTRDEARRQSPIGSVYFENAPRISYEVRGDETATGLSVTLIPRKCNLAQKMTPLDFAIDFETGGVFINEGQDIYDEKHFLAERVMEELTRGAKTVRELAEALEVSQSTVRVTLTRMKKRNQVLTVGRGLWGLSYEKGAR